jgi:hypothetical protein
MPILEFVRPEAADSRAGEHSCPKCDGQLLQLAPQLAVCTDCELILHGDEPKPRSAIVYSC